MSNYPDAVAKIAQDYLERIRLQLRLVPEAEQAEFLREIESHLYEAYQETPGEDEVTRILAVLRKLGEPAEVVADRLPSAMVRSGTRGGLPMRVLGGILIALFGIPLGFGGVGVLLGIMASLAAIVVSYYAVVGSIFLSGVLFVLLGLARTGQPHLWDRLVALGVIQIDGPMAQLLEPMSPAAQGLFLIVLGVVFAAAGIGMLRLGKRMVRGLRFLVGLVFDRIRQFAQRLRQRVADRSGDRRPLREALLAKR